MYIISLYYRRKQRSILVRKVTTSCVLAVCVHNKATSPSLRDVVPMVHLFLTCIP
ncbi:hypothetical protein C0J52_05188 [Blattella germanica]|nr:hypothetical protein C0J52_05188 [Blattella germanica]